MQPHTVCSELHTPSWHASQNTVIAGYPLTSKTGSSGRMVPDCKYALIAI